MGTPMLSAWPSEAQHLGGVDRSCDGPKLIGERDRPAGVRDLTLVLVADPLNDADDLGRVLDAGARA
jgi:hypothetical protein